MRQLGTTSQSGPVAIGGVGGSGTRLVAQMVRELGFYIGSDLNNAHDNLWFTLLFRRPAWYVSESSKGSGGLYEALTIFEKVMTGSQRLSHREALTVLRAAAQVALVGHGPNRRGRGVRWPLNRVAAMLHSNASDLRNYVGWGWKEPNTHIFLPQLAKHFPNLRYVHVLRHGLDMAYSTNQAQLRTWGFLFGIDVPRERDRLPHASLHYWAKANLRAVSLAKSLLGMRFFLLNYDMLCSDPEPTIGSFLDFLGAEVTPEQRALLLSFPDSSLTQARRRHCDPSAFAAEDLAAVSKLGFEPLR
jgi:hypothetical protein